jgi:hypothetical protein
MPANNGLWLEENQCPFPSGPEPQQNHPEKTISRCKARLRMPPSQNGQLLPKRQIP